MLSNVFMWSSMRKRIVCSLQLAVMLPVAAVAILSLAGCGGSSRPGEPGGRRNETAAPLPTFIEDPQHCAELLERAVSMAEPDQLGLRTDRKAVIGALNDWTAQCTQAAGDEQTIPIDERYAALIGEDAAGSVAARFFTAGDADHLRAALLLQHIASKTVRRQANEIDRVVALFDWVVRNVALEERPADAAPAAPFDVVVLGRGTPEDRAWVFAELLRQSGRDALLVRPAARDGEGESTGDGFLVGVPIDGRTFLFDVHLGTPVPSADVAPEEPLVLMPATLEDAASNPNVLQRLAVGDRSEPRFSDQGVASVQIEAVTSPPFSAPRMERLQTSLSGRHSAVVFEPLYGTGVDRGQIDRLAQAGGRQWGRKDVSAWSYPEEQLGRFAALDEQNLHERHRWLQAPFPIVSLDELDRPRFGRGRNELLTARLEQLLGPPEMVIPRYVRLRGVERTLVPGIDPSTRRPFRIEEKQRAGILAAIADVPVYRDLLRRAAQEAFYWSALAQYEQGSFEAAGQTLQSCLAEYPAGDRTVAARHLLSRALAEQRQYAEAAQVLRELIAAQPQHPGRPSAEWFLRRWQELGGDP